MQMTASETRLLQAQTRVGRLRNQLELLTNAFSEATSKKNAATQRHAELAQRLDLANRLAAALADEEARWEQEILEIQRRINCTVGDSLIRSAFLCFAH